MDNNVVDVTNEDTYDFTMRDMSGWEDDDNHSNKNDNEKYFDLMYQ